MNELLVLIAVMALLVSVFAVRAWRSRTLAPLVEAGLGMVAGAAAGVLWGVGARVAMRAVALTAGDPTQFTIAGTLLVLIAGAVLGSLLGLIFAAVRGWIPGTGVSQGLIFGCILLAVFLVPFALLGPVEAEIEELIGVGSFGALFVVFGSALGLVMGLLERHLSCSHRSGARRGTGGENAGGDRLSATGPVL